MKSADQTPLSLDTLQWNSKRLYAGSEYAEVNTCRTHEVSGIFLKNKIRECLITLCGDVQAALSNLLSSILARLLILLPGRLFSALVASTLPAYQRRSERPEINRALKNMCSFLSYWVTAPAGSSCRGNLTNDLITNIMCKQQAQSTDEFRRRVKAKLALDGDTIANLAKRVGSIPNTVSIAIKYPGRFPLLVAAIKKDLFGKKPQKKAAKRKGAA